MEFPFQVTMACLLHRYGFSLNHFGRQISKMHYFTAYFIRVELSMTNIFGCHGAGFQCVSLVVLRVNNAQRANAE